MYKRQVQAAVDAAYAAGGGCVFINEGEYLLSGIIDIKSNVYLTGAGGYGAYSTTLVSSSDVNSSDKSFITMKNNSKISGLILKSGILPQISAGNYKNDTLGIYAENADIYINNIKAEGFTYGVYLTGAGGDISESTVSNSAVSYTHL